MSTAEGSMHDADPDEPATDVVRRRALARALAAIEGPTETFSGTETDSSGADEDRPA